jgi:hypothetical protein
MEFYANGLLTNPDGNGNKKWWLRLSKLPFFYCIGQQEYGLKEFLLIRS